MPEVVVVEVLPRHPRVLGREVRRVPRRVDERHVHRLLGLPHVGRVGDEQRHQREGAQRQPLRPQERAARDRRPQPPQHERAGAREQRHDDDPHAPSTAPRRPSPAPTRPTSPAAARAAWRTPPAAGQAREGDRDQRRRRQPQYLDQHEEAQRRGHRLPETLMSAPVVTTYETRLRAAAHHRGLLARRPRARRQPRVHARHDDLPPARRRRGGPGRGRHLRPRRAARAAGPRPVAPARRRVDVRGVRPPRRRARPLPRRRAGHAGLSGSTAAGRSRAPALDLALRQAGRSLGDVVGREHRPVNFVVSLRLGNPPSFEPVQRCGARSTRGCASSSTARPTGPAS